MARSKKDLIALKIGVAVSGMETSLTYLNKLLEGKTLESCKGNYEAMHNWQTREKIKFELANVHLLYEEKQKKQKARMILAQCLGELKDGSFCGYKIRASMATFLRGIPTCPDPDCTHKGKEFEIEVKDEDIDEKIEEALREMNTTKAEFEVAEAKRREKERTEDAHRKFGGQGREEIGAQAVEASKKVWDEHDAKAKTESDEWLRTGKSEPMPSQHKVANMNWAPYGLTWDDKAYEMRPMTKAEFDRKQRKEKRK